MVTLTNGIVKYRCEDCGGLYDTHYQAQNRRPTDSQTNGAWHGCKAKPKPHPDTEDSSIGG